MPTPANLPVLRLSVLGAATLAYFVLYPGDLALVLGPVERVLGLSLAVSPWLYGLAAVGLACRTVLKVWGRRDERARARDFPPP